MLECVNLNHDMLKAYVLFKSHNDIYMFQLQLIAHVL